MRILLKIFLISLLTSISSFGQSDTTKLNKSFINYEAISKYSKPSGYINDYELLLSIEEEQQLDSIIKVFVMKTSNQIVIVTVSDVKPYESLQEFTTDLGNYWGVGQVDLDNGLIITVSKNMRNVWIGTGLGIETILSEEKLTRIIGEQIIPYLKKGEYFEGIKSGLINCINNWN